MMKPDSLKSTSTFYPQLTFWMVLLITWLCFGSGDLRASVVVYDRVTTRNTPVFLKFLTKGRLLPSGGQRVKVTLNDVDLRTILSGGDGIAYLKYQPQKPGIHQIAAKTGQESGQGILLVLESTDQVMIIDVMGGLFDSPLGTTIKPKSREVIESLGKTYAVIYIYRFGSLLMTRNWLIQNGYPRSVVLKWNPTQLFDMFTRQGIQVTVAIGAAAFMDEIPTRVPHKFCFSSCADGISVQNWDSILKKLKP